MNCQTLTSTEADYVRQVAPSCSQTKDAPALPRRAFTLHAGLASHPLRGSLSVYILSTESAASRTRCARVSAKNALKREGYELRGLARSGSGPLAI